MANNFYNTYVLPFTESTFNSSFATKGWNGFVGSSYSSYFSSNGTLSIGGKSYTKYKTTLSGPYDLTVGAIIIFKTGDITKYSDRNNIKIKNGNNAVAPDYENQGFIKCTYSGKEYYYMVFKEVEKTVQWATYTRKVNPQKTSFEPYEPVNLDGIGITVVKQQRTISSASAGSIETISTNSYESWSAICSAADYYKTIPSAGYYIESNIGSVTIEARFSGTYFSWTLTISDFGTKKYEIKENETDYKIYVGKKIDSTFLNHFSLVYIRKNDYKTLSTIVETALDESRLSKTIWDYNATTLSFSYAVNDNTTVFFSGTKTFVQLATGNTKFNNITIKNSYKQGEIFSTSNIDVKNSGYLLYSDGTSISLNDIEYNEDPSVNSNIGDNVSLDESILQFDITYSLNTKYFGLLTYTFTAIVEGQTDDYIVRVELSNAKVNFHANELLDFGENAILKCYNHNDEVIKEIEYSDFSKYLTSYPANYKSIITESLFTDSMLSLPFKFQTYREVSWKICIDYAESKLKLDTSSVKKKYFVGGSYGETITIDSSNIVIKEIVHENSSSLGNIKENIISSNVTYSIQDNIDVSTGSKVYTVLVSYKNNYSQNLTATYEISVIRYEAKSLNIIGSSDSTHYWDNNAALFHYPSGMSFIRVYSDGSTEAISELSSLQFYRNEALTERLTIGSSIIKKDDGTRIFVLDPISNVSGSFIIQFDEDKISSVALKNNVNFVLGNRLNKIRDSLTIEATHQSGIVENVTNYSFTNNSFILTIPSSISIVIEETEYALDVNKFTFIKPKISNIEIDSSNFPLTYSNISDGINAVTTDKNNPKLKVIVSYENADYKQSCYFKNKQIIEEDDEFIISCDELPSFSYDGSKYLSLDMGSYFEKELCLKLLVRNMFNESNTENNIANLYVKVVEITEITGISLVNVYTEYNVNDTFLNDNDTTEIQIFYKDSSGVQKKLQVKLNSGLSAINIFPLKGTKFLNVTNSKTIRITSATNYNVSCEYTISVNSKYVYSSTKKHKLVAIYQQEYELPNGETIYDKYILIPEFDDSNNANTKINSDGTRVLADEKIIQDIKVFGYLDDIFDDTKNARVILLDDYIPPIDGSNNITVKYPCYVEGNADKINNCKFGILFGNNNAKNRLFVSGNDDFKNCDWHSGQVDYEFLEDESMINGNFGYFEDTSYCYYGETDNAVIGYDIVSNDKLLVLKNKSDKETTVYFRTPTLVTAIDGSGNAMTGIDNETLYQEEFPLSKGNNSVAGISPQTIANFNGDTVFISEDNNLVGLDLTGIIGDNQRYANSRSYYIDEELKKYNLSNSFIWTNNKYLYIVLKEKIFLTHYETKVNNQYEWWVINLTNVTSMLEYNSTLFIADSNGQFYKVGKNYDDISKLFIGKDGSLLVSEGEQNDEVIVSKAVINQLEENISYTFKIIPTSNEDISYMYYQIGTISNVKSGSVDFFVNNNLNCLELVGLTNGESNYEQINKVSSMISEKKIIYLNHAESENEIAAFPNSSLKTYYKKYYLKKYISDENALLNDCYKLYDAITGNEIDLSELYRATLCYKLEDEFNIVKINKQDSTFSLEKEGQIINLIRYADQEISKAFKAEIISYKPVESYFITKPYNMGSLDYFKTIWSWTLTNDTGIPSELEVAYANNKIPFETMRTLAKISKDQLGMDFNELNFQKVDLQKNVVPRTYTTQRILSQLKFICFGFRNFNNTNSILSSMSIIYTIPYPSYGGD